MVDEYPYGRSSGSSIVSYKDIAQKEKLMNIFNDSDDEVCSLNIGEHDFIVRYDAPREDDKGRGHLSIWVQFIGDEYNKCYLKTGDDGEIYKNYSKISSGNTDIYQIVNKEDIDVLMR
jgi:hypothetical protein